MYLLFKIIFNTFNGFCYYINYLQKKFAIDMLEYRISFEVHSGYNSILVFPTKEMRDAFYENFKDLIEECKELL